MNQVYGTVTDANSGKGLSGIQVSIVNNGTGQLAAPGLTDVTDGGGNFSIANSPYDDGDTSVFLTTNDPSGKYLQSSLPYNGIDGSMNLETYPSTTTTGVVPTWVIVAGVVIVAAIVSGIYFKKIKL